MTRVDLPTQLSAEFIQANQCTVLYDSPHRLFAVTAPGGRSLTELQVVEAYRQILHLADLPVRLLNVERLANASATELMTCLQEERAADCRLPLGQPKPLEALITLRILQQSPDILDAYLEIVLRAEPRVNEGDNDYISRLQKALENKTVADYLQEWQVQASDEGNLNEELNDYRKEARVQLEEIHALKERLGEADSQREQSERMLADLREELDKKMDELNEVNSTLKLAYQELEHYFLLSKKFQSLLDQHEEQGARTFHLLSGVYRSLSSQ